MDLRTSVPASKETILKAPFFWWRQVAFIKNRTVFPFPVGISAPYIRSDESADFELLENIEVGVFPVIKPKHWPGNYF